MAGHFFGDVRLNGSMVLTGDIYLGGVIHKGNTSFLIDHPTDPRNKTLRHNGVESPEHLCIYRGKVTLDDSGKATCRAAALLRRL